MIFVYTILYCVTICNCKRWVNADRDTLCWNVHTSLDPCSKSIKQLRTGTCTITLQQQLKKNTCWECHINWTRFQMTWTVFLCWNTKTTISWSCNKWIALFVIASTCYIIFCWIVVVYHLTFFTTLWFRIDTIMHASVCPEHEWLETLLWTFTSAKVSGKNSFTSYNLIKKSVNVYFPIYSCVIPL